MSHPGFHHTSKERKNRAEKSKDRDKKRGKKSITGWCLQNLEEVIKIPLRELKNLGNKKIIKEVNRNKENVATLTKLSHINKPLMDEHRFRHLYIIKENKKTNQHKYIK